VEELNRNLATPDFPLSRPATPQCGTLGLGAAFHFFLGAIASLDSHEPHSLPKGHFFHAAGQTANFLFSAPTCVQASKAPIK
jgi:hypothetical protein